MRFWLRKNILMLSAACIVFVCALVFLTNVGIHLFARSHIYDDIAKVPEAQTVLIPGAAVSGKKLSPVFTDRVNLAINLYREGKASKILVSGDNSALNYNEVSPVRQYLLDHGVPDEDIFLDYAGFDTYSSMYRARDIFGVTSVVIATQSFHLPRAVFTARKLGLHASGVSADADNVLAKNYIREILANEKALLDLITHRKPKYLGEPVPITGDGIE